MVMKRFKLLAKDHSWQLIISCQFLENMFKLPLIILSVCKHSLLLLLIHKITVYYNMCRNFDVSLAVHGMPTWHDRRIWWLTKQIISPDGFYSFVQLGQLVCLCSGASAPWMQMWFSWKYTLCHEWPYRVLQEAKEGRWFIDIFGQLMGMCNCIC